MTVAATRAQPGFAARRRERLRPQLERDRRHEEDPDQERVHEQAERDREADLEQALELDREEGAQNVPARIRPALVITPPVC